MRIHALIVFLVLSGSSFAADLGLTMITPERVVASSVIDDHHAFEYRPEISILFSGWRTEGLTIAVGSDESGRLVSLVPFKLTLRSEDGKEVEAIDEPSNQSFFPAEIRAPDHIHIQLPISHNRFFRVLRPANYRLKMEVILKSADGKNIPVILHDAHITIEAKKG